GVVDHQHLQPDQLGGAFNACLFAHRKPSRGCAAAGTHDVPPTQLIYRPLLTSTSAANSAADVALTGIGAELRTKRVRILCLRHQIGAAHPDPLERATGADQASAMPRGYRVNRVGALQNSQRACNTQLPSGRVHMLKSFTWIVLCTCLALAVPATAQDKPAQE